jgi:hypothetical protein
VTLRLTPTATPRPTCFIRRVSLGVLVSEVPSPSPRVFLTRRQRAVRLAVGLNPDVLYSTGWSDVADMDGFEAQWDAGVAAAQSGECAVCRADGVIVVGQDRP